MHTHKLTLIGVSKPSPEHVRFEVGSIQGDRVYLIDSSWVSYLPEQHTEIKGFPFGAYLDENHELIMAPDWSEEIEAGLENESVLGK